MSDDRLHELLAGYLGEAYLGDEPPDLDLLRALAGRKELADAVSRLADSYCSPLPPTTRWRRCP